MVASIALTSAKSRKVYVLGEVKNRARTKSGSPSAALQAIALAGGATNETADLTSVILISKNIYGKPIGRRLDVKRTLDIGDMSSPNLG